MLSIRRIDNRPEIEQGAKGVGCEVHRVYGVESTKEVTERCAIHTACFRRIEEV